MKKTFIVAVIAILLVPSLSFAGPSRRGHRRYHGHHRARTVVIRKNYDHHYDGGAIAAGVLGGVLVGVILDRVITQKFLPRPRSKDGSFPHSPR